MNELGVNQLYSLSKTAKKEKKYDLEKSYLEKAISISPTNLKLINAYIRNLRKHQNIKELKKWLYILYELKPNGVVLSELISLERNSGNQDKVLDLLTESVRLYPESERLKKRLIKAKSKYSQKQTEEQIEDSINIVNNARSIIYSEDSFEERKKKIIDILVNQSEEIILCILSELYTNESFNSIAVNMIKKYKIKQKEKEDSKKIKLANKLLTLSTNKKTKKFNWDGFWRNSIIIDGEQNHGKVLFK